MATAPRRKASVKAMAPKVPRGTPAQPGRKSGARKDVLSSEVLDRAVGLFAERGFAGTSLKDVADAVGLSRPAIYYYFPSKDALLEELLAGVTVSAARILENVEKRDRSLPDREDRRRRLRAGHVGDRTPAAFYRHRSQRKRIAARNSRPPQ